MSHAPKTHRRALIVLAELYPSAEVIGTGEYPPFFIRICVNVIQISRPFSPNGKLGQASSAAYDILIIS